MIKHDKNGGFALIEVLLAIVVLAIGLLAGSKMQVLGLNYTQGALVRSQANMAANDIIDRMRINSVGVADNEYNGASTENPVADPGCAAVGCTPAQLADHDLREWSRFFGEGGTAMLPPSAIGTITGPDANGMLTVTINWNDRIANRSNKTLRDNNSQEARSIVINVII